MAWLRVLIAAVVLLKWDPAINSLYFRPLMPRPGFLLSLMRSLPFSFDSPAYPPCCLTPSQALWPGPLHRNPRRGFRRGPCFFHFLIETLRFDSALKASRLSAGDRRQESESHPPYNKTKPYHDLPVFGQPSQKSPEMTGAAVVPHVGTGRQDGKRACPQSLGDGHKGQGWCPDFLPWNQSLGAEGATCPGSTERASP